MATENFKEVMEVLLEDYLKFAQKLNDVSKDLPKDEIVKEQSYKVTFKDYCELYVDYLASSDDLNLLNDDEVYPQVEEESPVDAEADKPEETYY